MREQGMITQKQYRFARRTGLGLRPGRLYQEIHEPYFFGYVRDQPGARLRRRARAVGRAAKVYDDPATLAAARADRDPLDADAPDRPGGRAHLHRPPANGSIRAMAAIVPGRAHNQFNLLSQARRQPGSTFKTFVLAAAVERGLDPVSTYYVSAPFRTGRWRTEPASEAGGA